MYLRLVTYYEVFLDGEHSLALSYINDSIQYLEGTKMSGFIRPIFDAYYHISCATQAYVMAILDENPRQVIKKLVLTLQGWWVRGLSPVGLVYT